MKEMMKPKNILWMFGIIALAAVMGLSFAACGGSSPSDPEPSNVATLSGITIKGVVVTDRGTPNATLGDETAGAVGILATDTGTTGGTVTNANATVTKIVKFESGDTSYATNFGVHNAYDDETVAPDDFFVFEVTAENGDKLYYRVDVTVLAWRYPLAETNVPDAENFGNVRFFVSADDKDLSGYYTDTTYDAVVTALGAPVTTIAAPTDSGKYLYAVEFTAAGSGTVVRAGKSASTLSGTENTDKAVIITLVDADEPPVPPSAEIDGTSVTVTAVKANTVGSGAEPADETITITLTNASVKADMTSVDVKGWFSPRVEGLTYTVTAEESDYRIDIVVAGTPTATSSATAAITIPASAIVDTNLNSPAADLTVSGSVVYAVTEAASPLSGFTFTPAPNLEVSRPTTAANAVVGSFSNPVGGTGPYTYDFVTVDGDNPADDDNNRFSISGTNLLVKAAALTEARTYRVYVGIEDSSAPQTQFFDKALEITVDYPAGTFVRVGNTYYEDIYDAVEAITTGTGTIEVVRDFTRSLGLIIPSGKDITLAAAEDGLTITKGNFGSAVFDVQGTLKLGQSSYGDGDPVLVIDGDGQSGSLVSVGEAEVYLYNGAELRNSGGSAVDLNGTEDDRGAFFMEGGVIAGNVIGVDLYNYADATISGGIIYGTGEAAGDANTTASVHIQNKANVSIAVDGNDVMASVPGDNHNYTQTIQFE